MKDVYSEALSIALLKRRTKKQVVKKLVDKGYTNEEAEEAADYYKEAGYIDHWDYARRFANDAANLKGHGPGRIRMNLKERGVEDEIISSVLVDLEFDLEGMMAKRFSAYTDFKEKQKIVNYFIRRGFSYSDIADAMKTVYNADGD